LNFDFVAKTIFVDLLGSFFRIIQKYYKHSDEVAKLRYAYRSAADVLHDMLKDENGEVSHLTIVIDGDHTMEKGHAHTKRAARQTKLIKTAQESLRKLLPAEGGKITKRISAAKWKHVNSDLKKAHRVSFDNRVDLAKQFEAKGFTVVLAEGEADVWIARQPFSVQISGDSDALFHRKSAFVLRPKFTNKGCLDLESFLLVSKDVFCERLKLSNGILDYNSFLFTLYFL